MCLCVRACVLMRVCVCTLIISPVVCCNPSLDCALYVNHCVYKHDKCIVNDITVM